MLVTKDLDNKVFDYIDKLVETLTSIALVIRASYYCTIMATTGQVIFVRDVLFNLIPVVDWQVVTAEKQRKVNINIVR